MRFCCLLLYYRKMNLQAHISGQLSGQVSNQSAPSLPGISQQNGNSLSSQMQNPAHRNVLSVDPEFLKARKMITQRMYDLLFFILFGMHGLLYVLSMCPFSPLLALCIASYVLSAVSLLCVWLSLFSCHVLLESSFYNFDFFLMDL